MPNIIYTYDQGSLVGRWPGKCVRKQGIGPRREGQIYLGKVIDKAKHIFWKADQGTAENQAEQTPKRGRGRPRGSKNKKIGEREASENSFAK